MISKSQWWVPLCLGLIMLLSFFTFSENFFPLMNSDMAVNILMTPSFQLPGDIYFWGQNRSGSLIPLLTHPLYAATGMSPALAVSIVHYLLLTAGILALFRFIKTAFGRVLVTMIWFFPPWHFIEFLLILYGIQASCVIIALNFFDRFIKSEKRAGKIFWINASSMVFIIAVWVSDMAIISVLTLAVTFGIYLLQVRKTGHRLPSTGKLIFPVLIVLFWIAAGWILISYAKSISTPVNTYDKGLTGSMQEIFSNLEIVGGSVWRILFFSSEDWIESVFLWGSLVLVFMLLKGFKRRTGAIKISENPWFFYFLAEALITLFTVLISGWVAANGAGRRYFTTFFISTAIVIVIWLENIPKNEFKSLWRTLAFSVALIGSLSGCWRFYYPEVKPSRMRVLSSLAYMGKIGIIGEYWNAYIAACPDPEDIRATPHDKDYVRNPELAAQTLMQPRIFLIKDGWLNEFPDTIVQFGVMLKKTGTSFHIADAWLNQYKVLDKQKPGI